MNPVPVREWLASHSDLEPKLLEGAGFAMLVRDRAAAVANGDAREYVDVLARSPEEVDRLIAGIAVPETWLFRYPGSFEHLLAVLRRRLASGSPDVRMASIGCATGQEPYCMAMAALHAGCPSERIRVDALDRNAESLRIAETGRYGPGSIRGAIPGWAASYLLRDGDGVRVDERARACVRFDRQEIRGWSGAGYDVVFCRNVLIYLNADARHRLLRSIVASLRPGGQLFVGHAEQLLRDERVLRSVGVPNTFALEIVDHPSPAQAVAPAAGRGGGTEVVHSSARSPRVVEVDRGPSAAQHASSVRTLEDARQLADAGRLRESEEIVGAVLARDGPSGGALELLGLIRMAANDTQAARSCFEQAVYLEPNRTACLLELAMISERAGQTDRAALLWERARRTAGVGLSKGGS